MRIERFAPSPTGLLHLGHAYSAALGWQAAQAHGGRFLLRMEDLDHSRCRPEYYDAIKQDLRWLGLDWDGEVLCQSDRMAAYGKALDQLSALGLLYRCTCTRKDLRDAISAPQEHAGDATDTAVYPGTCRGNVRDASVPHALRLDMSAAIEHLGGINVVGNLSFPTIDATGSQTHMPIRADKLILQHGDVVLRRKDGAPAYHLAVVVDDAHQGISHVTRGEDLLDSTFIHRILQALLKLPVPVYHHHRLIRDDMGNRLAKRDDARSIQSLRDAGASPADIFRRLELNADRTI